MPLDDDHERVVPGGVAELGQGLLQGGSHLVLAGLEAGVLGEAHEQTVPSAAQVDGDVRLGEGLAHLLDVLAQLVHRPRVTLARAAREVRRLLRTREAAAGTVRASPTA